MALRMHINYPRETEMDEQRTNRLTRRGMFELGSAAGLIAASALSTAQPVKAGPQSGRNFEPLPDFKYSLEGSGGWEGPGGSAKEVTVAEFPVSRSIAGVSMRLTPGGLRELHWHAIAAEWAYIVEGRCRITVFSPNGQAEVVDFEQGDIWYFPKGYPHSLQGLAPHGTHFVLAFDNGQFSEFGTFSITDWFAQTSAAVLAQNTCLRPDVIARLPKREAYIVQGKVPAGELPQFRNKQIETNQSPHKYRMGQQNVVSFEGGDERIVSMADFPAQSTLSCAVLRIEPGAIRELHWHPTADEWGYVLEGNAEIAVFGAHGRSKKDNFQKGDVFFIDQGFGHYVLNTGSSDLHVLLVFNNPVYQQISLSSWLGANPTQLIADNFGLSNAAVDNMPKELMGMVKKS
jgi:oxalate decarboxylase